MIFHLKLLMAFITISITEIVLLKEPVIKLTLPSHFYGKYVIGILFSSGKYMKGLHFASKMVIIARGFRSGVEPLRINFCAISPWNEVHVLTPQAAMAQKTIYVT